MVRPSSKLSVLLFCLFCLLGACSSGSSNTPPDTTHDASSFSDASASDAGASDAGAAEASLPVWPDDWAADIAWSDFNADGSKSNTWTGHVSYHWALHAMRTDVVPPPGGTPGPPIGVAGAMLMRDGNLYFIPSSGGCSLVAPFGAPRPDWLSAAGAVRVPGDSTSTYEHLSVDLASFDAGLAGCFQYVFDPSNTHPLRFGGSSSCSNWPKGSYIEYTNIVRAPQASSLFDVPANCSSDSGSASATGCRTCHDAR